MIHSRSTLTALALAAAVAAPVTAQQQPAATAAAPSLIVFITVDQMRPDYFDRYASQLKGGLGRLYRGGCQVYPVIEPAIGMQ